MKIYTKTGDKGTTGLLYGGRVAKNSLQIELNGAVDEAQAHFGVVRSMAADQLSELSEVCRGIEVDLWVLMAEVATSAERRTRLKPGSTLVSDEMVGRLESLIDRFTELFDPPTEFVIPGGDRIAAELDVSRTVVRRAERISIEFVAGVPESLVQVYLNRLSDLAWTLARWREGQSLTAKAARDV